jgi:hypothetical protein
MAQSCDARMFTDFDDTCIVITRPDEFTSRLQNAIGASLPGPVKPFIYMTEMGAGWVM